MRRGRLTVPPAPGRVEVAAQVRGVEVGRCVAEAAPAVDLQHPGPCREGIHVWLDVADRQQVDADAAVGLHRGQVLIFEGRLYGHQLGQAAQRFPQLGFGMLRHTEGFAIEGPGNAGHLFGHLDEIERIAGDLAAGDVEAEFIGLNESTARRIQRVVLLACGTSYHAALVGKYWIEAIAGVPTQVEIASEYRYRHVVVPANTLFVTLSQSGETADTLAAELRAGRNVVVRLQLPLGARDS